MIFLDTDHLSVLTNRKAAGHSELVKRLDDALEALAVPVVCVQEQCEGWLAKIRRLRDVHQQIPAYERLINLFLFFADWEIFPFQNDAADMFVQLRSQKIRIGTQDLKIAAMALAHEALLLSANLRDFRQVPGLRVENWL